MNRSQMNKWTIGLARLAALSWLCFAAQTQAAVPAQASYPNPEGASQALLAAVSSADPQALRRVLGGPDELFIAGDAATQRVEREQFAQKYGQMHRLARQSDGTLVLYIGAENWPFPVPLVQHDGAWRFDPEAGLREVLFRRIGENELTAIDVCHALAAAGQPEPGAAEVSAASLADPLDSFLDKVRKTSRTGKPVRFHGYDFLVPKAGQLPQGHGARFTAVAWPAEYRSSGVMTFVVDREGVVHQKDLGTRTAQAARQLTAGRLDHTWARSEEAP